MTSKPADQIPLSRNRNFTLLWASMLTSDFGFSAAAIAIPLLVLTVNGSAADAGLVLGTVATAQLAAGLPAGALAGRWNRKYIMLGCEAAQAIAGASLVAAILMHVVSIPQLVVVAAVIGVSAALFGPAEDASLPNIVPDEQVQKAVAMNAARTSLAQLSGTGAGGFLFAVGRVVPFAADMVSHALAFFALTFVRLPPREVERQPISQLHRETLEGVRWVWQQRLIRVTTLCAVVLNLFFSAFYIIIIVLAHRRGIPAGQIGVMAAMLGAGGLVGALLAPALTQKISPFASIASVFWILTVLTPVAIFIRNGYVLGALLFAIALLPPTANTTIMARQLLLTPDNLRGRLSGALGLMAGGAAAVGPMLGGVLIAAVSGTEAVLVCAVGMAGVTVLVTASPTLRHFPRETGGEGTGDGEGQGESTGDGTGEGDVLVDVPEQESADISRSDSYR
jgi:MFS family permease